MTYDEAFEVYKSLGRGHETEDGKIFFIKVDRQVLEMIRVNPRLLLDVNIVKGLLQSDGENIHILRAQKNESIKNAYQMIRRAVRVLIKTYNPRSISWFNQSMSKFVCWSRG